MKLAFDRGTLLLHGEGSQVEDLPGIVWDTRVCAWRAPARYYSALAGELARRNRDYVDKVRPRLDGPPEIPCPDLRPYQAAALATWERAGRKGMIALPTGAGKTRVAVAAISIARLRTLCLVPTRVLMAQWTKVLGEAGAGPIGEYGDGRRIEQPITVATYASALCHVETLGNRFDLLVIDEVHHFGSGTGNEILEMCTAAARLGLSATLPDDAGRRACLECLVGPEVYRVSVEELAGRYLAAFDLVTISLQLTPAERTAYETEMSAFRPVCRTFFKAARGASWSDFLTAAAKSDEGRRAISAWRRSHAIVRYSVEKRAAVADLLSRHRDSRILVFAADNETAYTIARDHLVHPITCETGPAERARALDCFSKGELRILVSARVLNEGLDVPAADIAIIVGGSQGCREYVQRVGRILRPSKGKTAVVYDLVAHGTFEVPRADRQRRALASG